MTLPFSQACENNKEPIVRELERIFVNSEKVLELGSGTGQHAAHFAPRLPYLTWQTSDLSPNHDGINARINAEPSANLIPPIEIDVSTDWPEIDFDAVFSANTLHIIPWNYAPVIFHTIGEMIKPRGIVVFYGPFNYNSEYTSESNKNFDAWLKSQAPHQGIRDFEAVDSLADMSGLELREDIAMPANNRLLVWQSIKT